MGTRAKFRFPRDRIEYYVTYYAYNKGKLRGGGSGDGEFGSGR